MRMQFLNQSSKACIAVIYCTGVKAGLSCPFQNFARCAYSLVFGENVRACCVDSSRAAKHLLYRPVNFCLGVEENARLNAVKPIAAPNDWNGRSCFNADILAGQPALTRLPYYLDCVAVVREDHSISLSFAMRAVSKPSCQP